MCLYAYLLVCLSVCSFVFISFSLSFCLPICPFVYSSLLLSVCPSVCLSVRLCLLCICLSFCLFSSTPVHQYVCLSVVFFFGNFKMFCFHVLLLKYLVIICLSVRLSISLFISSVERASLSFHLSILSSVHSAICPSIHPSVCATVCLSFWEKTCIAFTNLHSTISLISCNICLNHFHFI